jgi:hypothetical protein
VIGNFSGRAVGDFSGFSSSTTPNPKNPKRDPMETGNPGKTRWKSEKSPKETHLEPDGHLNLTRNLMGSGASFNLQVQVSNSHQLHFFVGQVFDQPDSNRPIIIPSLSSELETSSVVEVECP